MKFKRQRDTYISEERGSVQYKGKNLVHRRNRKASEAGSEVS